jgi:hypothetical protein
MMDFDTLFGKFQALLAENKALKEQNLLLKERLGLAESVESLPGPETIPQQLSRAEAFCHLHANSDPSDKIRFFMSLFNGRDDVYARRWESSHSRPGYAPACLNEWKPGLCRKPKAKCALCEYRSYAPPR